MRAAASFLSEGGGRLETARVPNFAFRGHYTRLQLLRGLLAMVRGDLDDGGWTEKFVVDGAVVAGWRSGWPGTTALTFILLTDISPIKGFSTEESGAVLAGRRGVSWF